MKHGGARPGAGRPKRDDRYVLPIAEVGGMSPLEFLLAVIRDPNASAERRDRAAISVLPYCHPKIVDRWAGKREIQAHKAKHALENSPWADILRREPKTHLT